MEFLCHILNSEHNFVFACNDFDSLQNESDKYIDFATIVDCVSAPVSVGSDLHLPKFWPTLKAESATMKSANNFRAKTVISTSFDTF